MVQQSRRGVYPPRGEPEIIPPGADWPPTPRSRVSNSVGQVTLVRIARLGPVGIVVALLVLGMLAALTVVLLLGLAVFGVATTGVVIIGAAISLFLRGTFPRFRYDQLMKFGWKYLIPLGLGGVAANAVLGLIS